MPTKIRLQRHGKKKSSFFHIVIADGRAPRDGKFIDKIGTYNPNTNPATIDLEFDKALNWLKKGAQPSDTAKAILSYEGVVYKKHLDTGVLKGAFTQDAADKKFEAWKADKMNKIQAKTETVLKESADERNKRLAHEAEVNKKRAQDIAAKQAEAHAAHEKANAPEAEASEEAEATTAEATPAETTAETATEAPAEAKTEVAEEKAPEAAEEKAEEPKAEVKAEEPKAEEPKAEAKAEEPKKEEKEEVKEEPKADAESTEKSAEEKKSE